MVESSCGGAGLLRGVSPPDGLDRGESVDGTGGPLARAKRSADILLAAGVAVVAALAAAVLPSGSTLRIVLVLPIVLFAPGYLLLQALIVPARSASERGRHALLSVGVSPALVGLLALSTAIIPGGFKRVTIGAVITLGCLVLAGVGLRRRWASDHVLAGEEEEDVTQTA